MTLSESAGQKIGSRFKQCAIILHRGQAIVNFVQKFVAIATGSTGKKFK